jgi:hypothetical protein
MESCSVNLIGPVELGHSFVISGITAIGCKNFKVVISDGDDGIPLNILVDMTLKQVVINSFANNEWTKPVRVDLNSLEAGNQFKFCIFVSELKFHIALNGHHLVHYSIYFLLSDISNVRVFGDLEQINQVDHRRVYPSAWPPIQEDIDHVAFSGDIPYKFSPGCVIIVKMRVSGSPSGSFFIRFNEFGGKRQLFHFNPRFAEKLVVANIMNDSLE